MGVWLGISVSMHVYVRLFSFLVIALLTYFLSHSQSPHTPNHSIHGDDKGLVIPPILARYQVLIVPIVAKKSDDRTQVKAKEIAAALTVCVCVRVCVCAYVCVCVRLCVCEVSSLPFYHKVNFLVSLLSLSLSFSLSQAVGIRVFVDDSNQSPGEKFYHWEMKGE